MFINYFRTTLNAAQTYSNLTSQVNDDINGGSAALNTSLLHPETDPAARTVLADGIRGGSSSTTCACVCALNALEILIIDCIWTEFFEEP